jgi:hypothetical protein
LVVGVVSIGKVISSQQSCKLNHICERNWNPNILLRGDIATKQGSCHSLERVCSMFFPIN